MAEVGKPSGLVRRGGVYYLRLRYPSDVASRIARVEFNRSLRTGLYTDALKELPAARAAFDAEVLAARAATGSIQRTFPPPRRPDDTGSRLSEDLAHQLAFGHFQTELRKLDREQLPPRSVAEWQDYVADVEMQLATLSDADDPNTSRWTEAAEIELLSKHNLCADAATDESLLLRAYLRRSMIQIGQLRLARLHDDYGDEITDRMFDRNKATSEKTATLTKYQANGPVMLDTEIVDLWAAERKPVQKGIDDHRSAARWLYERVGRKSVDQLSRDDFLKFKAKLLKEGQSSANVRQKLSRLRTLMQWAADNGYADTNPAHGVSIIDRHSAKNKRQSFDLPALTAIFSSPVYTNGERPIRLRGEAGYWLPLLALFTGARLEELGQLRPDDVSERTYADGNGNELTSWFIHIREDSKEGLRLKNAASERRVPVHPELIRRNFVSFVKSAKDDRQKRLFPLLRPNKYGRVTAKWGEYWSIYRKKVCGVTDPRMVFHSFRHTFKDYARLAMIPEGLQRQLMGHSGKDVADDYGSGYPDHRLVEAMATYKVPGLKMPDSVPPKRKRVETGLPVATGCNP